MSVARVVAVLAAVGAFLGGLEWRLNPVHERLDALNAREVELVRRVGEVAAMVEGNQQALRSVVGYLRGGTGLPRIYLMDEGCR